MAKLSVPAILAKQFKRIAKIPHRLRHESNSYRLRSKADRVKAEWSRRHRQLNRIPGVFVDKDVAFLSKTANLDFEPSGAATSGKIHLSSQDRISDGVILAPYNGSIHLEENVFLGPYCVLYGHGGIKIGKNSLIAGHTFIVAANHIFADIDLPIYLQQDSWRGIIIGEDVWIGCGARILDGVSVGNHCVVGAGAVVTKSLPPFSIAVGVPAKVIGYRTDSGQSVATIGNVTHQD